MKSFSILFLSIFCWGLAGNAFADETNMPPPPTNPQFETIKSLEGTWVGEGDMHGKKQPVEVRYRVTSGKTAVEETLFPGSPHEMVSVYFMDGDNLMMTHYCTMGNQPRMKMTEAKKTKKGETISLKMVDATGMKTPQDPHMGALTLTLKGKDNLVEQWESMGPQGSKMSVFTYQRKK
jgi:hypothetical protein